MTYFRFCTIFKSQSNVNFIGIFNKNTIFLVMPSPKIYDQVEILRNKKEVKGNIF